MIFRLSETGLRTIEATSFVSPKWVPQMANHDQLFKMINKKDNVSYPVLIPNEKGLEKALEVGVKEIAVYFNLVGFCGSFGIFQLKEHKLFDRRKLQKIRVSGEIGKIK